MELRNEQFIIPEIVPKVWYSYEYFPPKNIDGMENLVDKIARMGTTYPAWVDVTWGHGEET